MSDFATSHSRSDDRFQRFFDAHVEPRLTETRRLYRLYRTHLAAALVVAFTLLVLNSLRVLVRPLQTLRGESALERELAIAFLPVDTVTVVHYENVAAFLATPAARRRCVEVPLDELRIGRTAPSGGGTRHALANLVAINHRLIRAHKMPFAAPKIYRLPTSYRARAPDACVLSFFMQEDPFASVTHDAHNLTHMLDAVNPIEVEWSRNDAPVADVEIELVDTLFAALPRITVDSQPRLRVRYRALTGEVQTRNLVGDDAHLMRFALRLMNHGEPPSLWGSGGGAHDSAAEAAAPPPPPTRLADEL